VMARTHNTTMIPIQNGSSRSRSAIEEVMMGDLGSLQS
jgi:hypothetical protein